MKKLIATLICITIFSMTALPVAAQRRARWANRQVNTTRPIYDTRYDNNIYNDVYQDNRSVWEKHRDKITTAGGAVGGAVLGGLLGGKKGAIIGAIAGGGGAAVYTYKIRDKYPSYPY